MSMNRRFPIQTMPTLEVSELEHLASKELMHQLLAHTIREFEFHSYHNRGIVDTRRWKPQTHRDDIELYRERKVGVTGGTVFNAARHCRLDLPLFSSTVQTLATPTMLLTGYGHGRVEDAMSAVVTESQHDLALAVKFKHQDVADCAILKTLESPTQSKPYHYLGFKFFVRKSPTEGHLFKHRHSVYLEYSGLTHSSKGEKLGFHLMHSIELPAFSNLSNYNSIRALQSTRYIYRQKSTHTVELFMLGNMDIAGHIFKPLANKFTVDMFFGVARLLELAQVRRLSQMAQKQRTFGAIGAVHSSKCNVCTRFAARHKLVRCQLCGEAACKKCTTTKRVFVSDDSGILGDFVKVPACRTCVRRANTGIMVPPYQRVLRTSSGTFNFHKVHSKPDRRSETEFDEAQLSVHAPGKRRETFPSESALVHETSQYVSSLPMTSKLYQQEEENDLDELNLNQQRWTEHTSRERPFLDRRVNFAGVEPVSCSRAPIASPVDTPVYSIVHQKTKLSMDLHLPTNMSLAQRTVMTRLQELSKIAEDASTKTRLNALYCDQHWRKEVEANRLQIRRAV
ncbi:hypothetical protein PsorP6_017404 [Peronosclerospora sorghi]|uniref:Uncharacterized protein n=1 Tax=Peronosclerospora sorghi TaxID=230839 RepID=A0ACC0WKZ8_9STRA|nr:hypothetical protein PsorP6_017404 [Peronosclerospora sorghi]